jgi:hypothetical protein
MRFNMNTIVQPCDVVGVYISESLSFYGRVEEIGCDVKPGWLKLRLQVLTVPSRELTWILEPSQIDGDTFTMGGTPIRLERLSDPKPLWLSEESVDAPELAEQLGEVADMVSSDEGEGEDESAATVGTKPTPVGAEVISFPPRVKTEKKS